MRETPYEETIYAHAYAVDSHDGSSRLTLQESPSSPTTIILLELMSPAAGILTTFSSGERKRTHFERVSSIVIPVSTPAIRHLILRETHRT